MSFFGDLLQGRAAQQAANYNASLLDRDAKIKEQKGKQGYAVYTNYELPKFNDSADKIIGEITENFLSSNVAYSGTVKDVLFENALNLERDRDMMQYNAEVNRDQAFNDAINTRAEAALERYRGKVAKKASYYQAGQSLLTFGKEFL